MRHLPAVGGAEDTLNHRWPQLFSLASKSRFTMQAVKIVTHSNPKLTPETFVASVKRHSESGGSSKFFSLCIICKAL